MPLFGARNISGAAVLQALDRSLAIIEFTSDGKILKANENFLRTMGYRIDEVVGQHHRMFVDPHRHDATEYAEFWKDLGRGTFKQAEFKRIGKGGREVWLQATYNPILGLRGRTVKVIKFATDITALKFQNANYVGQVAAIGRVHAVAEFKLDGTLITANENFLAAFKYSLDEIKNKHHSMFVHPADRDSAAYRDFWPSLARGEYRVGIFRRLTKVHQDVWIEASYNPILDMDGRPFKVVKYATDVTQNTLINIDHAGQLQAIRKSQAVIEFNMDGVVQTANDKFTALMGYSQSEIVGQHHAMFVENGEATSDGYKTFWDNLKKGQYQAAQYKRVGKNGREVWIEANYNPIVDAKGQPYKVVKFATDITDKMRQGEVVKILSMVADGTDNSVIVTNPMGVIEYVNPGFTRMTGFEATEVIGQKPGPLLQGRHTDAATVQRMRENITKRTPFYDYILN